MTVIQELPTHCKKDFTRLHEIPGATDLGDLDLRDYALFVWKEGLRTDEGSYPSYQIGLNVAETDGNIAVHDLYKTWPGVSEARLRHYQTFNEELPFLLPYDFKTNSVVKLDCMGNNHHAFVQWDGQYIRELAINASGFSFPLGNNWRFRRLHSFSKSEEKGTDREVNYIEVETWAQKVLTYDATDKIIFDHSVFTTASSFGINVEVECKESSNSKVITSPSKGWQFCVRVKHLLKEPDFMMVSWSRNFQLDNNKGGFTPVELHIALDKYGRINKTTLKGNLILMRQLASRHGMLISQLPLSIMTEEGTIKLGENPYLAAQLMKLFGITVSENIGGINMPKTLAALWKKLKEPSPRNLEECIVFRQETTLLS